MLLSLNKELKCVPIGAAIFIFALLFMTLAYPAILKSSVKKRVVLKKGSQMREELWTKKPFPIETSIYLFNVTNPDDVDKGEKVIVKELGPYYYHKWESKTNITDYEEDDTVSYVEYYRYFFDAIKSQPLTGNEEMTAPIYFVLGLTNYLVKKTPALVPFLDKAVESVWNKPSSLFVKMRAQDILFDGLKINCNATDFGGSLLCSTLRRDWGKLDMIKLSETQYVYTIYFKNHTDPKKPALRINRGLKNVADIGTVVEYNGKKNRSIWKDQHCDAFTGTDGIFHPFFDKKGKEDLSIYNPIFCRSFNYKFVKKVKYQGLKVLKYATSIDTDAENNPLHKCYCEAADKCLKKGAYDIFRCIKSETAFVLTNPHLLWTDKEYMDRVGGLGPDEEKHSSYLLLEPLTGSVVYSHMRIQVNMPIFQVQKFKLMKDFRDEFTLLPLYWYDEKFVLPSASVKKLQSVLKYTKVACIVQIITMIVGLLIMGWSAYKFSKFKRAQKNSNASTKKAETHPAISIS